MTAEYVVIDLLSYLDDTGITAADDLGGGSFNIWSNTFPAEHLPPVDAAGLVEVEAVPFRFPAKTGGPDNLRCDGRLIGVPVGRYDWIYLLAAAERRTEDPLRLHFADGSTDPEWLRVPDFWPQTEPHFGFRAAIRFPVLHYPRHVQPNMAPSISRVRVPVPREADLAAIRLPDNPAIHIFAMTARAAGADRR
ncbi:MAG: hypothetical protein ACM30G_10835 [Micromonosporaceae bacterium]